MYENGLPEHNDMTSSNKTFSRDSKVIYDEFTTFNSLLLYIAGG